MPDFNEYLHSVDTVTQKKLKIKNVFLCTLHCAYYSNINSNKITLINKIDEK